MTVHDAHNPTPPHEQPATIADETDTAESLPFDLVEAMTRFDGDKGLLVELMTMFLDNMPEMLRAVRQALADRDPQAVAQTAHTLKGTVGNFAAKNAFDLALTVEMAGRIGDLAGIDDDIARLETELHRLADAFVTHIRQCGADVATDC